MNKGAGKHVAGCSRLEERRGERVVVAETYRAHGGVEIHLSPCIAEDLHVVQEDITQE